MKNTTEYLAMSETIAHTSTARELHHLRTEITNSNFTAAEQESLLKKIAMRFGQLNAGAVNNFKPRWETAAALLLAVSILTAAAQSPDGLLTRKSCVTSVKPAKAQAAAVTTARAVDAIIGEAGNQPFATQVLVAKAIRNRGSLSGVYGVNNPVVRRASAKVRATALRAWQASAKSNDDFRFFGCDSDRPYFASLGLRPVLKSGDITFYQ